MNRFKVWLMIETDEDLARHLARARVSEFSVTYTMIVTEIEDRATAVEGPTVQRK